MLSSIALNFVGFVFCYGLRQKQLFHNPLYYCLLSQQFSSQFVFYFQFLINA